MQRNCGSPILRLCDELYHPYSVHDHPFTAIDTVMYCTSTGTVLYDSCAAQCCTAALLPLHGCGTFKKPIFATRCLLGHPLPLEPLVSVSAPAHSPLPPDEKPSLDSQDVLVAASARSHGRGTFQNQTNLRHPLPARPPPSPGADGQRLCPPCPFPPYTRREALPRLPGRLGGRLSTLTRAQHFQETNLRHPLPARPPPSPGAAGQRLCPRPFPPSTRREALPRLPGRLGGRLSTLTRARHFQETTLRHPLPARPPPSPGAASQHLCLCPIPLSTCPHPPAASLWVLL